MKPTYCLFRRFSSFAFAIALLASSLHAEETTNTIKFSDPSKPGRLKIVVMKGDLQVQGADTTDVTVRSDAKSAPKAARKDGLRVLTDAGSFSLTEKDNVITLDTASDGWRGGSSDLRVTVPRNTSVIVQNSFGGDIACAGLNGDIEVSALSGSVRLDDIAGGAVVGNVNGEIHARIRELHPDKPLSFQSTNGEVEVRVPSQTKASVRLRTQNGAVLTDFPENALVTKMENAPRVPSRAWKTTRSSDAIPAEAREVIKETARLTVQAGREVAEAVREGLDAARADSDRARSEADRMRVERDRVSRQDGVTISVPIPPRPPGIPTMSGGKLVTGTLNGGGPEISISTVNGDVILRQLDKK
ncbi:MAG: DUF4097 family beta strand repeat-containing protein [Opitutaceae bacterium]